MFCESIDKETPPLGKLRLHRGGKQVDLVFEKCIEVCHENTLDTNGKKRILEKYYRTGSLVWLNCRVLGQGKWQVRMGNECRGKT